MPSFNQQLYAAGIYSFYTRAKHSLDVDSGLDWIVEREETDSVPHNRGYDTNFYQARSRHERYTGWYVLIFDTQYKNALASAAQCGGSLHSDLSIRIGRRKGSYIHRQLDYLGVAPQRSYWHMEEGKKFMHVWRVHDFQRLGLTFDQITTNNGLYCGNIKLEHFDLCDSDRMYRLIHDNDYLGMTLSGSSRGLMTTLTPDYPIPLYRPRAKKCGPGMLLLGPLFFSALDVVQYHLLPMFTVEELDTLRLQLTLAHEEHLCELDLRPAIDLVSRAAFHHSSRYSLVVPKSLQACTPPQVNRLVVWVPFSLTASLRANSGVPSTRPCTVKYSLAHELISTTLRHTGSLYLAFNREKDEYKRLGTDHPFILNQHPVMQYDRYIVDTMWHTGMLSLTFESAEHEHDLKVSQTHSISAWSMEPGRAIGMENTACLTNSGGLSYPRHVHHHPHPIVEFVQHRPV